MTTKRTLQIEGDGKRVTRIARKFTARATVILGDDYFDTTARVSLVVEPDGSYQVIERWNGTGGQHNVVATGQLVPRENVA